MIYLKKAVIFDFDGVIINSNEVQKQAFFESYKTVVGRETPSFKEFLSYSGDSLQNIFTKMRLPLEMVEVYRRISREKINCIKVHDGMRELLILLGDQGFRRGLCTGKDRERTMEILNYLGFGSYFESVVCSDDVISPKPEPESLYLIMKLLGVEANNSLMVGDARNDIICAKAAGVTSIAVTWGDVQREELEMVWPDFIVNDVQELSQCIFGENNPAYSLGRRKIALT